MHRLDPVERHRDGFDIDVLEIANDGVGEQKAVGDDRHTDTVARQPFNDRFPVAAHKDFAADQVDAATA